MDTLFYRVNALLPPLSPPPPTYTVVMLGHELFPHVLVVNLCELENLFRNAMFCNAVAGSVAKLQSARDHRGHNQKDCRVSSDRGHVSIGPLGYSPEPMPFTGVLLPAP